LATLDSDDQRKIFNAIITAAQRLTTL